MSEDALLESFDRLGLSPEASLREVERSYRELRDLFSKESLATYSLMDSADRQSNLASIQMAYDRILKSRLQASPAEKGGIIDESVERSLVSKPQIIQINVDPKLMPGLYLQQMRKARGMSLHDVAERTKIGMLQLQSIEGQNFDALPAPVYVRGYLKEFSMMVKVPDAKELIDSFMALYLMNR